MPPQDQVGFGALRQRHGVRSVQPLLVVSRIGTSRSEREQGLFRSQTFTPSYRPTHDSERGHFEFGLKYEDLNLEWMVRSSQQRAASPICRPGSLDEPHRRRAEHH